MEVYVYNYMQWKCPHGSFPYVIFFKLFIIVLFIRHIAMVATFEPYWIKVWQLSSRFVNFSWKCIKTAYWVKCNVHLKRSSLEVECSHLNFLDIWYFHGSWNADMLGTTVHRQQATFQLTAKFDLAHSSGYPGLSFKTNLTKKKLHHNYLAVRFVLRRCSSTKHGGISSISRYILSR